MPTIHDPEADKMESVVRNTIRLCRETKLSPEYVSLAGFLVMVYSTYKHKLGADESPDALIAYTTGLLVILMNKFPRDYMQYWESCLRLDEELNKPN